MGCLSQWRSRARTYGLLWFLDRRTELMFIVAPGQHESPGGPYSEDADAVTESGSINGIVSCYKR